MKVKTAAGTKTLEWQQYNDDNRNTNHRYYHHGGKNIHRQVPLCIYTYMYIYIYIYYTYTCM